MRKIAKQSVLIQTQNKSLIMKSYLGSAWLIRYVWAFMFIEKVAHNKSLIIREALLDWKLAENSKPSIEIVYCLQIIIALNCWIKSRFPVEMVKINSFRRQNSSTLWIYAGADRFNAFASIFAGSACTCAYLTKRQTPARELCTSPRSSIFFEYINKRK